MWWPRVVLARYPRLLGRWGERRAELALRAKGYKTIARNVRSRLGEIDLVMQDNDGVLVFVEVKTRLDEVFQPVEASINAKKLHRLRNAIHWFIAARRLTDIPMRCDVVAIVLGKKGRPQIRHYPNAFVP